MTAIVTNDAIEQAVGEGQRLWTQALMVSVRYAHMTGAEKDRGKADLLRAMGSELSMTPEEIAARYDLRWTGPYSRSYEEDERGNSRPIPLDRADYHGFDWQARPKRHPDPGAVYVARQPLEGDEFTIGGLQRAFRALVDAHGAPPQELRLGHRDFTDYCNLLCAGDRRYLLAEEGARFDGVPVKPQRYAPRLTLLAVYPLPGIGA